jgi:hypothetical protein
VAQLVGGVADNAVRMGSRVTLGELEVATPHGVAHVSSTVAIDQSAVGGAVAAFAPRRATSRETTNARLS